MMLTMLEEFTALMLLLTIPSGTTIPLSSFYSYGSAAGDTLLPPSDDGSSPNISLPAPFLFFGTYYSTIFVSLYFVQILSKMNSLFELVIGWVQLLQYSSIFLSYSTV